MKSGDYIQQQFQCWARRSGVQLQGSQGKKGALNYTHSIGQNIFGGKLLDEVVANFKEGDGGELKGKIPPISALHSSAALAVNLFQYWVSLRDMKTLASLLKVPSREIVSGRFEDKFPVCDNAEALGFRRPPNLDFALRYKGAVRIGVECKLFEPYRNREKQTLLSRRYLGLSDAWRDIPAWHALAQKLAKGAGGYSRLDAAQLVKHILGLKFGSTARNVRLIYLYYDAIGVDAVEHNAEIQRFQSEIDGDPVRFVPVSVQEFVLRAARQVREEHRKYVDYLAGRYL